MDGLMSILRRRQDELSAGTYYVKEPRTTADKGIRFGYEIVDEPDRNYAYLLNNLETPQTLMTIKTDDNLPLPESTPYGYVATQNGEFFRVIGYVTRYQDEDGGRALKILKKTNQTKQLLRLSKQENPMELR